MVLALACSCADDPDRTLVEIGGEPEWVARYLAGMPFRFDVLETAAVCEALRELGTRLVRDFA